MLYVLESNIPLLTQNSINGKRLNWTPTGYAPYLPWGDKAILTQNRNADHFRKKIKEHPAIYFFNHEENSPTKFFRLVSMAETTLTIL